MVLKEIKAHYRDESTLNIDVTTDKGLFTTLVPSTVHIDPSQAQEIKERQVNIINNKIAPRLIKSKVNVSDQATIDDFLDKLDEKDKSHLGVNTILGVSVGCCKAGAAEKDLPLYKHIATLMSNNKIMLPVPCFSMINGGKLAGNDLPCQELAILPICIGNFANSMQSAIKVYQILEQKIIDTEGIRSPLPVNDKGAFAPKLEDDREALALLNTSIRDAGYEAEIKIALNMAAGAFYKEGRYDLAFKKKDSDPANYLEAKALGNRYLEYFSEFPGIVSIEDPFHQDDSEGWLTLSKHKKVQIVSDAPTKMNIKKIEEAINKKVANCLILRMSEIGTVTEIINCAEKAKKNNWNYIVSASCTETEDNFIADLAVGLSANQFKAGAPYRNEKISKYNRILQIEEELGRDAKYAQYHKFPTETKIFRKSIK